MNQTTSVVSTPTATVVSTPQVSTSQNQGGDTTTTQNSTTTTNQTTTQTNQVTPTPQQNNTSKSPVKIANIPMAISLDLLNPQKNITQTALFPVIDFSQEIPKEILMFQELNLKFINDLFPEIPKQSMKGFNLMEFEQ